MVLCFRRTVAKSSSTSNVDAHNQGVENVAANEDHYEMMDAPPSQEAKPYTTLHAAYQ